MQSMDYSNSVELNIDAVPSAPTLSSGAQIEAAEFDNNPETSLSAIYIYWKAVLQSLLIAINIYWFKLTFIGTLVGVKACVATFSGLSAASIIAKSAPRSRHLCIKSSPRPSNFCPRHHTPCLLNSSLLYYDASMVEHRDNTAILAWLNNSVKRSYITCRDLGSLWQAVLCCVNNVNFACVVWIGACCCSHKGKQGVDLTLQCFVTLALFHIWTTAKFALHCFGQLFNCFLPSSFLLPCINCSQKLKRKTLCSKYFSQMINFKSHSYCKSRLR